MTARKPLRTPQRTCPIMAAIRNDRNPIRMAIPVAKNQSNRSGLAGGVVSVTTITVGGGLGEGVKVGVTVGWAVGV